MVVSERTERLLELVEIWNSGDLDAFLETMAPDFEFTPDPSFPDAGTYRGDDVRRWMRDWAKTWEGNRLEVLDMDERPPAVVMTCRWHLGAPQTGDEIPVSDFSLVLWLDADDQPRRMAAFFDRDRALAAITDHDAEPADGSREPFSR
jgi:ketosteroid isomerase-like protein